MSVNLTIASRRGRLLTPFNLAAVSPSAVQCIRFKYSRWQLLCLNWLFTCIW